MNFERRARCCPESAATSLSANADLGSTACVQLKMARAAELVCKLYHNSPDRVLPASRLQPRGYVDKILLERPSTDQALRVVAVRVACTKQGRPVRAAVRTLAPGLVERRLRIRRSREGFATPVRSRGICGGPGRYRSPRSVGRHWSRGRRNTRKCRAGALARNCGCS